MHWSKEEAASLIDALAAEPPIYHLPEGAVHAHTRHYMPAPTKKTLVFDAFAHLPDGEEIVVAWPEVVLEPRLFDLVTDLADGIGYLGIVDPSLTGRTQVDLVPFVEVHGNRRRALQYHRFRSRGRERASDPHGALLRVHFPEPVSGPVALGYGCHFGLGLFTATDSIQSSRPDGMDLPGFGSMRETGP